ncbi:MAG: hypothetical protein ACFE8A_10370 [Candidatus Hodarchaeota archaeon]
MISKYVRYDWIQPITDIIGFILNFLIIILIFIGEMILIVINFLLNLFPYNMLWLYIIIAAGLVVASIIVNTKWSGLEYTSIFSKVREEETDEFPVPREDL